jgi:hypothetical protein
MPMTVQQILRKTSSDRVQRAEEVKIIKVKSGKSKSTGNAKIIGEGFSITQKGRTKYTTSLEVLKKGVMVSCSCDDFAYRFEYALHKKGAAELKYSNGDPPIDTNPSLIPGCCKHLVKLFQIAAERGVI